jgi:glycerol kinase
MAGHVLVIDEGTTSTRGIVFDAQGTAVATAQLEFGQIYPRPGWVEHDPEEIWAGVLATARQALQSAGMTAGDLAALGIANQRETVVIWDRQTGRPIHNAIVWQDRRTAAECDRLEQAGHGPACGSIRIFRPPRFPGCWTVSTVPGRRRRPARSPSAPSTVSCCGG